MFPNQMMKPGFLGRLNALKNVNWTGILDGTQKTLGIINQAIPIVYQVKPIINNARTMFRIADVIKSPSDDVFRDNTVVENNNSNKPIFYI
ncbi:MAG: hypothetical protein J6C28_02000 [Bacilli bacterium]|nr:hypothetical protein [Bacilli bacterium]